MPNTTSPKVVQLRKSLFSIMKPLSVGAGIGIGAGVVQLNPELKAKIDELLKSTTSPTELKQKVAELAKTAGGKLDDVLQYINTRLGYSETPDSII